ncbi:MAG: protein tlpB [Crocinitomicaceae bacterium]|nr:protein tlpB [Crocinitomicaceae bacterium]
MNNKLIGIWVIRIIISLLFLVSAYAKVYHEPSAYFSITTFEAKQLVPLGFSSEISSYLSRILIALEFAIGVLILLPFYLKRIVIPLTIFVLAAFCVHLALQIYLTGNSGNCGCFGTLLPMTPLEAILKNIFAIGLLAILNKLVPKDKSKSIEIFYGFLIYLFFVIGIMALVPIKNSSNVIIDSNYQIQEDLVLEGPKQMKSEFGQTLPFADKGRLILCFFAPGCDHCRAAVRSIDSLSKIVENFPKVEIVFMDEEVDKIPEFFEYAGSEYHYIVLDISTFYDVLTWERDTPGIFYMWNGNILKEFNGTNDSAYDPESLLKSLNIK